MYPKEKQKKTVPSDREFIVKEMNITFAFTEYELRFR